MKPNPFTARFLSCWLLALALWQASLPPLSALPPDPAELPLDFGSELTRLLELSTRLSEMSLRRASPVVS
jgi:hypothetical protein